MPRLPSVEPEAGPGVRVPRAAMGWPTPPSTEVALAADGGSAAVPEAVRLLDGGVQAYPRMLQAIAQARRSVHLEVYAFAPSRVGAQFVEALRLAARRGVAVQVLIDGWGSARGGRAIAAALRDGGCEVRIFLCGLGGGWRLRRRYLKAFDKARERIHIAHGYFLPDPGVLRAITAAAARGVQVRLLLAGRSDVPFARAASRSLYRRLLAAGVAIHEWNESVLHAKVATVDGRHLLVGSFNLDPYSLANLETLAEVSDAQLVEQGEAWIQDRFARSRVMTAVEASTRLQRWLFDPLGRLVARLVDAISRVIASRRRRRASLDESFGSKARRGGERDAEERNRR